jgi:hypothetical protein
MSDPYERFTFQFPGVNVDIHAIYNTQTGRLDLEANPADHKLVSSDDWVKALMLCDEHSMNYFYLSEVRQTLREAGVDPTDLP